MTEGLNNNASNDDLLRTVRELVNIFKPERYLFLVICILSAIILFVCVGYLMYTGFEKNLISIVGMFTSSGVFGFFSIKIFKMWDDVIVLIKKHFKAFNNG
jgi:CHASE2 domain-containing sensor protein